MLIGITGKAGAGKDTIAEHLWKQHSFVRIAFADPLKLAAQQIFGLTDAQTWARELKEVEIPHWGMSPRRMFQLLGTEAVQGCFGREVWAKRWMLSYDLVNGIDHVVVPDVRFPHEADMIHDLGGIVVEVVRPTDNDLVDEAKKHVSENGLPSDKIDSRIVNDGDILQLQQRTSLLVGRWSK